MIGAVMTAPFEKWRLARGLSYRQLADLIEVPQAVQARRYCIGGAIPRPETISRITQATGGEITADALYEGQRDYAATQPSKKKGRAA